MVIGRHAVFPAEHIVCTTVIPYVHQNKKIVSADAGLDDAFAVPGGETGTFDRNQEGILVPPAVTGPFPQMRVDFFTEFFRARQRDDIQRRHSILQIKNRLSSYFVRQLQRLLFRPRFLGRTAAGGLCRYCRIMSNFGKTVSRTGRKTPPSTRVTAIGFSLVQNKI